MATEVDFMEHADGIRISLFAISALLHRYQQKKIMNTGYVSVLGVIHVDKKAVRTVYLAFFTNS
jgi:hypothetical protein